MNIVQLPYPNPRFRRTIIWSVDAASVTFPRQQLHPQSTRCSPRTPTAFSTFRAAASAINAVRKGSYPLVTDRHETASRATPLPDVREPMSFPARRITAESFSAAAIGQQSRQAAPPPVFAPGGGTCTIASWRSPRPPAVSPLHYTTGGSTPSETVDLIYSGVVTSASTRPCRPSLLPSGVTDSNITSAAFATAYAASPSRSSTTLSPGSGGMPARSPCPSHRRPAVLHSVIRPMASTPSGYGRLHLFTRLPVSISTTATLKVIGFGSGFSDSTVTSATSALRLPRFTSKPKAWPTPPMERPPRCRPLQSPAAENGSNWPLTARRRLHQLHPCPNVTAAPISSKWNGRATTARGILPALRSTAPASAPPSTGIPPAELSDHNLRRCHLCHGGPPHPSG